MLIPLSTEVGDSDAEASLDFFLGFNEMQILLLTKARLAFDICASMGRRKPLAVCAAWPEFCV